jgi:hypothetical protein
MERNQSGVVGNGIEQSAYITETGKNSGMFLQEIEIDERQGFHRAVSTPLSQNHIDIGVGKSPVYLIRFSCGDEGAIGNSGFRTLKTQ